MTENRPGEKRVVRSPSVEVPGILRYSTSTEQYLIFKVLRALTYSVLYPINWEKGILLHWFVGTPHSKTHRILGTKPR
jgi:hypothetical protein